VVREPVEATGNAAGCYGLLIVIGLVAAVLTTLGLLSPEKNEINVEITAEH
jgi:hypothetical protein